ncbi:hypothetical protein ABZ622_37170 [Streptomyces sp. NPDC007164]|uniref:hypothetical protein n=1 Tax=Streptomyces sp. NPDC007164 TaxID=3156918 RepID=UPI0033F5D9FA
MDAIVALTLRHGNVDHLVQLGSPTYLVKKELLSALLVRAVQDKHIGRQVLGYFVRLGIGHSGTRRIRRPRGTPLRSRSGEKAP